MVVKKPIDLLFVLALISVLKGSNTAKTKKFYPMSKGKTPHFVWDFTSTEQFSAN